MCTVWVEGEGVWVCGWEVRVRVYCVGGRL